MLERTASHGVTSLESWLRTWRTQALNLILTVTAIVAVPVIVIVVVEAVRDPAQWPAALAFVAFYLLIMGLVLTRRLSLHVRVWGLLLLGYAAGALAFARGGLAGDGRVYLLALPALTMLLVGIRAGVLMAGLSLLAFITFAVTAHLGWMADWLVRQDNTLLLIDWVAGAMAFGIALSALIALQWSFGNSLRALVAENIRLYEKSEDQRVFHETIVQNMKDGILLEDAAGHITFVNPRTTELLGYASEDLIGRHWKTIVAPECVANVEEETAKRSRAITSRYEVALLTNEGQRVPVEVGACPLFEHGRFTGVLSVITDIGGHKQMVDTLRAGEERLRTVVQKMPVMLDALDAERNIIAWNRECERVTGYSAEEIIGNPRALELLYPDADYLQRLLAEWGERGDFLDWELELTSRDGGTKTVAWSNISTQFPIPGWAAWAIGVDVTQRKQALVMLQEREEMLQAVLNTTTESVILVDSQMTILTLNQTAAQRFGKSKDELVGLGPEALCSEGIMPRDLYESRVSFMNEVIRSGKPVRFEDEREETVFDTHVYPVFGADGKVARLAIFARDITARKRAEQQAMRAERLAAMGQLAAALAHEINNPLQVIRGNLELLTTFRLEQEEHRQRLAVALQEIDRLTDITRRVLDFARPAPATRYPVSITDLVQRTLMLMTKHLQRAHIHVTTDVPTDLPHTFAVPDQIIQVLLNLTINAVEAMSDGGHLYIRAAVDRGMIALSLTNDGPHLPAEHIERVFDPFFTTKSGGMGLGLSISHGIIQQHGGAITVENLEGERGVTFTVVLPVAHPADEQETAA